MQWILSLISAPLFNTLLKGWQMKLDAANQAGAQAADVAKAAMIAEVQQRATNASVVVATLGHWYTALPMILVMAVAAAYFIKCVAWDTMLGLGTTEKLGGDIQTSYNLIMSFWFGAAGARGMIAVVRGLWR